MKNVTLPVGVGGFAVPLPVTAHGEGVTAVFTVAQKVSPAPTAGGPTQSAGVAVEPARRSRVPLMAPPGECHSKTLTVTTVPPWVKSLRTRISPFVWAAGP